MNSLWKEPTSLFQDLGDSNLTSHSLMHVHFPASYNSDGLIPSKNKELGSSLAVQWLGLRGHFWGPGFIPGWGTETLQVM